jgi:predicted dehydrogenase
METAVMALEAGMHVFCEKPMALSPEQCELMTKTAKKHKKVLVIGQVLRFKSEYVFLRDAVRSGKYGKLQSLTMSRVGKVSVGWKGWFLDEKRGGTQIFDRHIHDADMISWIFGLPESVTAYGFERPAEEGGISHSVTKYNYGKNGPLIVAEGSADMPGKFPFTATYRAVFEKACLDFDMGREKQLLVYTGKETFSPESPKEMIFSGSTMNQNIVRPYFMEQEMFFDCIRKGSEPEEITPESAGDTVRLVRAEIRSFRTGKTVKL